MAGYSGTPLPKKLGIGADVRFGVRNPPDGFDEAFGEMPVGATRATRIAAPLDVVVSFHRQTAELLKAWPALCKAVAPNGAVWIGWPKKSSGLPTDITENRLRDELLPTGWVDTKVCAIDDTWSGLRFVLRKELRPTWPN
jgi:hypothetical protein